VSQFSSTCRSFGSRMALADMLSTQERLRVLSRLFTRPVLASIARTGTWLPPCSFLERYGLLFPSAPRPLSELFHDAWMELRCSYRNEYVYKNEIANRIVFGLHSPRTAALHVELPVGGSIVDIAVFNGTSTAYEIKTEFDSARRLQTQTRDYLAVFEKVFVVTHPIFAEKYANLSEPEVGVLALNSKGQLSIVRNATANRQRLNHEAMFRCLHRNEYIGAVEKKTGMRVQLPNGIVRQHCLDLFALFDKTIAHNLFVDAMRSRKIANGTPLFLKSLPQSLRALGSGTPLSERHRHQLLKTMQQPIHFAIS